MSEITVASSSGGGIAIPEHMNNLFAGKESNITTGDPTPKLSIAGKVWKVCLKGDEKTLLTTVDGEQVPTNIIKVVILNHLPARSRAYYENDFSDGSNKQPDCWSTLGDKPDNACSTPQAATCETCPKAVKGSKLTNDGTPVTACGQNKRIVVVPSADINFHALLLKLPVTSLWEPDGSEEANGWYAYDAYLKYLKANGIEHTAAVETTMKFDSKTNYPKVLFKYSGILDIDKMKVSAERTDSDEVMKILHIEIKSPEHKAQEAVEADFVEDTSTKEAEEKAAKAEAEKAAKAEKAKKAKEAKAKKEAEAKKKEEEAKKVEASSDDELGDILSDWS